MSAAYVDDDSKSLNGDATVDRANKRLVRDPADPRVLAAALGIRPSIGALHEKIYFAPNQAHYESLRNDNGVEYVLFGTSEQGNSIAARVQGFRPYFFVALDSVCALSEWPNEGDCIVELVQQLNGRLLAAQFASAATWSAERRHACRLLGGAMAVGKEKKEKDDTSSSFGVIAPEFALGSTLDAAKNMPIVDWQIEKGLPVRGFGKESGYRGLHERRYLKLFFYSPNYARLCVKLLHAEKLEYGLGAQLAAAVAFGGQGGGDGGDVEMKETRTLKKYLVNRSKEQNVERVEEVVAVEEAAPSYVGDESTEAIFSSLAAMARNFNAASVMSSETKWFRYSCTLISDESIDTLHAAARQAVEHRFGVVARSLVDECSARDDAVLRDEYDVFEADFDPILRLLVDCKFSFEHWISVARSDVTLVGADETSRTTHAQIEMLVDWKALLFEEHAPIQNTMARHVLLSLDCEMAPGPNGAFPDSAHDPMLQCVCVVRDDRQIEGRGAPPSGGKYGFWYRSVSFTLGTCNTVAAQRTNCWERYVIECIDERTLFRALAQFVHALAPTLVTGYNSDGFDLPYMIERSKVLGVGVEFARGWSRTRHGRALRARAQKFESSAHSRIDFTEVSAGGLTFVDVLQKLRKDGVKLRSMTLNSIASHFLGDQKEDLAYSLLRPYQCRGAETRELIRVYCEKDALLPLQIAAATQMVESLVEMARINGCSMTMLVKRGQTIRAMFCFYRTGAHMELRRLFYTRTEVERRSVEGTTYEGAVVLDAKIGLYANVATLDFSSLYPSIMITHNYCATTRVAEDCDLTVDPTVQKCADPVNELSLKEREKRAADAVYVVEEATSVAPFAEKPTAGGKVRFLKHGVLLGLGAVVLDALLLLRKRVKAEMKRTIDAGDTQQASLLNQRQLAIKLLCNSVYGIYAAITSFMYDPVVPASVTMRGRAVILLTQYLVTVEFSKYGVRIIYGDTDSVFVWMPQCKTLEEAASLAVRMAAFVTKVMHERYTLHAPQYNRLNLEFEKIAKMLLLLSKKKYAMLKYEYKGSDKSLSAVPAEGVPTVSGLESKKRDTTMLIKEQTPAVLALLLSTEYGDLKETLRLARDYVWTHMVRPILYNNIAINKLIITKQLRGRVADYVATGRALSMHVDLARRLTIRAGGEQAPNAPRSGDRLPYVVFAGAPGDKVSVRAEDPSYAFANDMPLDPSYYLSRHIGPVMMRIFAPILAGQSKQRTLKAYAFIQPTKDIDSDSESESDDDEDDVVRQIDDPETHQFLFGSTSSYVDQFGDASNIIPATVRIEMAAREKKIASGVSGVEPVRDNVTQRILRVVRHRAVVSTKSAPGASKKRSLSSFAQRGAKCGGCGTFVRNQTIGFRCESCTGDVERRQIARETATLVADIEDLAIERSALAQTCHSCMGCAQSPSTITCENVDCGVLWRRKANQRSTRSAVHRLSTITVAEHDHLPHLARYAQED